MNRRNAEAFLILVILFLPVWGISQPTDSTEPEYVVSDEQEKPEWLEMTSAEDLYSAYPDRMKFILQNLDLERDGLEKVKQAYESGNIVLACKHLLEYYKDSGVKDIITRERPSVSGKTVAGADSIVADIITIQRVSDQVPRLENGHLNWHHTGPEDDMEYAWLHNRHSTVGILLDAWFETGNPKYANHIDHYIKDWIISSWPYPGVRSSTAMWRGLEVRGRVINWMPAFFNLIETDYLSPATQLLILSSLPEHAHYLRNFHAQGNWLTMEMNGLATIATYWPEYDESLEWAGYAINTITASLKEQVYPDGVQTELTSHYHLVALRNFEQFIELSHLTDLSLPGFYTGTIEEMWEYLAVTMRPDGYGVLNNDSDKTYNRDLIKEAALTYNRKDWQYIATNGRSGEKPDDGPSFVYPWAGQVISRGDYGPDAHWSFFDIGTWGTGHQHNDKLHLSIAAFGRDLLVDSGRFAYRGEVANRFREYALGSQSHNLVLIDGKGQAPGPGRADEPIPETNYIITDEFDYASSSFDDFMDLEGTGEHTRSIFYVRGEFWIVVDHIATDRPRELEVLWHWHPENSVQEINNGIVSTDNQRGNLKIIPAGNANWGIDFIKGQEEPVVQGWYSKEYNIYEHNTATIYSTRINSGSSFAWVLFPSEKKDPEVNVDVLAQDSDVVQIKVSVPDKEEWVVSVPFLNSAEAGMESFTE